MHLAPYVGERVTFEGRQHQGLEPGPGDPVSVNVTSLEPVDGGQPAQEIVVITGALEPVKEQSAEGPTHTIKEHGTGDVYGLFSDAQGVNLSQYEGQSVAIYGVFQTLGAPISNFEDLTEVPIYVTSIESLEPQPVEPPIEPNAKITGVISANPDALVPGGEPTSHLITEDGTGDVYEISSYTERIDLTLHEGMHVTIKGVFLTLGNPLSDFEDLSTVPINVTSLKVLDDAAPSEAPDAIITGVIQPTANPEAEGSTHTITEDDTGDVYGLFSNLQDDGVDLSQYVGQRVTITGYFQTQGTGTAGHDLTDLLIYVESVEVLDSVPATRDDQYVDESTAVETPATDDVAPEDAVASDDVTSDDVATDEVASGDTAAEDDVSDSGVLSVLPDTGGFAPVTLALISLLLLSGGGLLAFNLIRR
ncbi:hypothetical protein BH24ACT22_BH24ACT22_10310 [soil metagenome]